MQGMSTLTTHPRPNCNSMRERNGKPMRRCASRWLSCGSCSPASCYHALAKQVESGVSRIVARCKLPPAADAQLHIIVAELMSGAELMASPADAASARKGAVKVIEALNQYGEYFNDIGFNKLSH